MDIKLSAIFEEILHKSNPPNVSIMGRIWQSIGWKTKRLELTYHHLVLLHTMLDSKFYDWVQPNLEILRSIKSKRGMASQFDGLDEKAKLEQVKSHIKIKIIPCPQRGCIGGEMMLNVKFMGYQFVGTFNRNELDSNPLKKHKVIYYPCTEEKKDEPKNDIIDDFLKEMSYAYLSKTNLLRCDDDIFGLFNATTSQLITFIDFSDGSRIAEFSEFVNHP